MPVWLIALIVAALGGGGALVAFGGFGGSSGSNSDFWNPERCNETLQADVADLEEYQALYKKATDNFETGSRRGDATFAENAKKSMAELKTNTAFILNIVDTETIPQCGRGVFRDDLLKKVEAARIFLNGGTSPSTVQAEGMPDVRVTDIKSTFIPYETDEKGVCSGPYLDIVLTITNQGADFPRPVDIEDYEKRAKRPGDELEFFFVTGELDFGGGMNKSLDFTIMGKEGRLASGSTLKIPTKIKVENNQTHARGKASLTGIQYLKTGSNSGSAYETEIDIPIWDIYAESHAALDGIDPDTKQYYISGKAVVSNKGPTPTPGPIEGSFTINEIDPKRRITGWVGKTSGPVSGSAEIYARTDSSLKLPTDVTVQSSIHLRCPNGEVGYLSDGNTKNNSRELQSR